MCDVQAFTGTMSKQCPGLLESILLVTIGDEIRSADNTAPWVGSTLLLLAR